MMPLRLCIYPRYELRRGHGRAARRVHLTPGEGQVMTALLGRREIDRATLIEVMWPDPWEMPDYWRNPMFVKLSNLRRKVERVGYQIIFRAGHGWRLVGPGIDDRIYPKPRPEMYDGAWRTARFYQGRDAWRYVPNRRAA